MVLVSNSVRQLTSRLGLISILVADSDAPMANLIRSVLKNVGFTNVTVTNNGNEALQKVKSGTVDLLITDWRMDPIDGVSLIQLLRQDRNSPNRFLPIIMLTAKTEIKDVEIARDVGVTEYIVKPFTAKSLLHRIVKVIENPRQHIISKGYCGPDRRHKQIPIVPPDVEKRRNTQPTAQKMPKL